MGGLFNPPPTDSSYPDIPVPNFHGAAGQVAQALTLGAFWDDLVNKWHHSKWDTVLWAIGFAAGAFDDVFAVLVKLMTAMQGLNQPGFFALLAAILGDLLGIEFDAGVIAASFQHRGRIGAMTTVGGDIFNTLSTEFSLGQTAGAMQPSDQGAKGFLGFLAEFAVRQGNVALLSELIPIDLNPLGGLREYGEILARNLGLGRLARRALQPLVQVLVADPLQWKLNAQYRPRLLSEGLAVKAYLRGKIDQASLTQTLSWQGYSDAAIQLLIDDNTRRWQQRDLLSLFALGTFSQDEVLGRITLEGVSDADATQLWQAWQEEQAHPLLHTFVNEVLSQVRDGYLSNQDAQGILANLPLLPLELQRYKDIFGQLVELPRKHLSESEAERAFLGGIIDMTTIQTFWTRLGYSTDSIQTLTLLLLEKQSQGSKTSAGHTPHKRLSEAQLERAYKDGIINIAQLQAGWTALGYPPNDILILTAMAEQKVAPPGTTAFPTLTTP